MTGGGLGPRPAAALPEAKALRYLWEKAWEMQMTRQKKLMSAKDMANTLERLAIELIERREPACALALVGIQRRGAELAGRLKTLIEAKLDCEVPLGKLDINLYRDDWTHSDVQPQVGESDIPFSLTDKNVVLVDDVLFSGRTIRAALEAVLDYGRPKRVELLVLIDRRGHRELPIQADYVGKRVHTAQGEHVDVTVAELDGEDMVNLVR